MNDARDERVRLALLFESARHASGSFASLQSAEAAKRSGRLEDAARFYGNAIEAQELVLTKTEELNRLSDQPTDVVPIVGTLVNILFMYADILDSCKRREDGEATRTKAVALSKRYLGTTGSAEAERSRAAALTSQARFNEALIALHNAQAQFASEGNVLKSARTSIDLADLLQWLGDFKRASDALDHADEIYEEAQIRGDLGGLVDFAEKQRIAVELPYYRGLIAKQTGQWDRAEELLKRVLPTYQRLGSGPAVEFQLAAIAAQQGKFSEALDIADRIEPAMRAPGLLRPKLAALLKIQGQALAGLGDAGAALNKLEEGINDLDDYYDPDLRWRLEWQCASTLARVESVKESIQAYAKAIDTVVNLRKAPLGYRLDSTYLVDKMEMFDDAITLAADQDLAQPCAVYMDSIKSRTLSAILSTSLPQEHPPEGSQDNQFEEVTRELDAIEYKGFLEGWSRAIRQERAQLLERRTEILEELRFADPRWRNMTVPVSLDVTALMNALRRRNQAALSLFKHDNQVSAVVLTGNAQRAARITIADRIISKLYEYVANLQHPEPNPRLFDPSGRLSIQLESLVPEDLISLATQCESVVVVPHGELHLLPWAGLLHHDRRFFEYCAVGVLPNLTSLLSLYAEPAVSPTIALVGDPDYSNLAELPALPYAAQEISQIADIYRERGGIVGEPVTGAKASEISFGKVARDPVGENGILHVCCHGGIEFDEPMNSGLYMSDGKIDAAEIARTPLTYSEVILSSCSCGWRPSTVADVDLVADDILGLSGAFLEAGARSVLLSIPKATDRISSEFMVLYHKNRSKGDPPLTAYRDTQLAMLHRDDIEPALWLGYTLYGCR